MTRTFFIILTIFSSTLSMSQTQTFSQTVNNLFFGVDVSNKSSSLLDSFLSVSQLHHRDTVARQWNLNVAVQMKTDKQAWSARHEFSFSQGPLPDLKLSKGLIEVTIGEAGEVKKLLDLNWHLEFENEQDASKYFEKLKQDFSSVSTKKKFDYDKDVGHMAQFSTRKQTDIGVKDVTIFLSMPSQAKKYRITLLFGNKLMDE